MALMMSLGFISCSSSAEGEAFLKAYEEIVVQAEQAQKSGDAAAVEQFKKQADDLIEQNAEIGITSEQQEKLGELMGRMVMVELNAAWGLDDNDSAADGDQGGEN